MQPFEPGVERLAVEHVGAAHLDAGVRGAARAVGAASERDHGMSLGRQPAGHEAADVAGRAGYSDVHP